jgi:hypothetical protein
MNKKESELRKNGNLPQFQGIIEQQFYLLLKQKLPDAEILYENHEFESTTENGRKEKTVPDFYIRKSNGSEIFVEITAAHWSKTKDPKEKQKRIMEAAIPQNAKYVVLYRHHLVSIEANNPDISFFGSRKMSPNNHDIPLFP